MDRRAQDRVSRVPETVMLSVSVFVVLAIGLLSYRSGEQNQWADRELRTSRALVDLTHELLSTLKDAETGQRGFLLTGDDAYLEPYNRATAAIPAILKQLEAQTAQHPDQALRLNAVEQLVGAKLEELKQTVELRRGGNEEAALAVVDSGEGRAVMDRIRERCAAISQSADNQLQTFTSDAQRSSSRLRLISTAGSAILLVFIVLAALTIFRAMNRREELYAEVYTGRKLLGTTLSSIADAVISTDDAARVTFINPAAEQLTGWSREEALGIHITTVFQIFREGTAEKVANPLERALAEGAPVGLANHTALVSKSGQEFPVDDSAAPIRDESGRIIGAVLVFRDISVRRRNELRLAASTLALQRSNEDLEHFAHVAAHDLRSPLHSAQVMAQLLARRFGDRLGPEGEDVVTSITDGMNRMSRLVDDLLIFAQAGAQAGESDLSAEPTPIPDVLAKVLRNLDAEIEATGARITCDSLPTVTARETQMLQLIQNIIGNAIKYRGEAPPRIHVSCQQIDSEWVFSVHDNGAGIEAQYLEEVFKPFKRLHGPEYEGSGIGLATCRKIVTAYGGRIWVESEVGRGSTFFFTMPVAEKRGVAVGIAGD